jgi:thiamine biosynthesis lipoprotein ApbE/Na+-translocating ferredoxin:NAD+ oxidoreductase RnfG subunit
VKLEGGHVFFATLFGLSAAAVARAEEEVYLTREQAFAEIFSKGERLEEAEFRLTAEERLRIEARLRFRLAEEGFSIVRGIAPDGALSGYAVVTEEIGKYEPITFLVGVDPGGAVKDVAIMVYRESRGSEVKRRRFLSQFRGKTVADPIQQNRDIINVSGATLSVRSVARGVRKVLCVVNELLIGPERRAKIDWRPLSFSGAKSKSADAGMIRRARYVMGTILEAKAYGEPAAVLPALEAIFEEVRRLDRLLSRFREDSEISRMNREAGAASVSVSEDTFFCVAAALDLARRSGGAFDPTLEPGGFSKVSLDSAARAVRFAREGIEIDLGGIGKGYALERAAAILRARGVDRAALDFGGQVLVLDPPPGAQGWLVAISSPGDREDMIGGFELARASVSTSGQEERPGHLVDPRRGAPAAAARQATVVAPSAMRADSLSTAAFVLGPAAGAALVAEEEGASAVIVPPEGGAPIVRRGRGGPEFRAIS